MRKIFLVAAAGVISSAFAIAAHAQTSAPDTQGLPAKGQDSGSAAGRNSRDEPTTTTNGMAKGKMTKKMSKKKTMKKAM